MFDEVCFSARLPNAVNWVFDAFKHWHPVVIGSALRDTLRHRGITEVDIAISYLPGDERRLKELLLREGGYSDHPRHLPTNTVLTGQPQRIVGKSVDITINNGDSKSILHQIHFATIVE